MQAVIIYASRFNLEYDIYSLTKSFYAGEELEVIKTEEPTDIEPGALFVVFEENKTTVGLGEISRSCEVDYADRSHAKNVIKRQLYSVLSEATGKSLPWGTLSGVRPTKLFLQRVLDGMNDEDIRREMRDIYCITDAKIDMGLKVAHKESEVLSKLEYKDGYSLYIGIPFCPSTCAYCSFTSYPIGVWKKRVDDYLTSLETELSAVADMFADRKLQSIYIGGGTPTSIEAEDLDRLLGFVESHFDMSSCLEFTVEAGRPDSITREKLMAIKKHSVTRISVNPQTMNQKTLDRIGRFHTVEQLRESFAMAREVGFDDINMDFIAGLPGESFEDFAYSMEEAVKMAPDNLTVHSLALKRAARMNTETDLARRLEPSPVTAEHNDKVLWAADKLGLEAYYLYRQQEIAGGFENVGFSKPGKEGIYNILIMEEKQSIVACGAGATSKRVYPEGGRIERCENVKDVDMYIEKIDEMIDRKRKLFGE